MDQRASKPAPAKGRTTTERVSPKELVVTRRFNAPARLVFEAWATPEIFQRWWLPESFGITVISCELDVRTGGSYRLVLGHPSSGEPMAFFGRYLEVIPNARIVWTNEEAGEAGAVTTATFEEKAGAGAKASAFIFAPACKASGWARRHSRCRRPPRGIRFASRLPAGVQTATRRTDSCSSDRTCLGLPQGRP